MVLLPRDTAPRKKAVIEALSRCASGGTGQSAANFSIVDEPENEEEKVAWVALIAGPAWPSPIVVWAEPSRPLPKETIDFLRIEDCRWAVGLQTLLPDDQPHVHQHRLVRMIAKAMPDSRAILNVNTGGWHTREELETALLPTEMEVGPALLFMVHVIADEAKEGEPPPRMFAYTVGLHTAGRAELEMHGIEVRDGRAAAGFLTSLAELLVEEGLPEPGEAFEVGMNQFVRLLPANEVAAAVESSWIGSVDRRMDHDDRPLRGERIAVCASDAMTWPADVARAVHSGKAAMFRTRAMTERDARIARRTFDRFIAMFQMVPASSRRDTPDQLAAFVVKAGFAVPNNAAADDDHREHLWFEVVEVHNGRVRGKLLNEPSHVRLREGDLAWIDRNLVSDWQVMTPRGQFGPAQHPQAAETLGLLMRAGGKANDE